MYAVPLVTAQDFQQCVAVIWSAMREGTAAVI